MTIIKKEPLHIGKHRVLVYHLQTPQRGHVAVTHLPHLATVQHKANIVMMPGMFSNRRFWLSDKGLGLAAYLSSQGFACWMIERRGQGLSGKASHKDHTLYNCFEHDLPALQKLMHSLGQDNAFYMGHSFGGVLNTLSLANGYLNQDSVLGLINFSSQLTVGKRFLNKPYSAFIYGITALLRHFPAKHFGMGPENESIESMRDGCRLVDWAKGAKKDSFWRGIEHITCPVLGFGSDGDRVDPAAGCQLLVNAMGSRDKTFIRLGKQHGHRHDYDHVGMVVSKDAQQEVWPMVLEWLNHRVLYPHHQPENKESA